MGVAWYEDDLPLAGYLPTSMQHALCPTFNILLKSPYSSYPPHRAFTAPSNQTLRIKFLQEKDSRRSCGLSGSSSNSMNRCSHSTDELVVPHNAAILTAPTLKELQATLKQSNKSCPPLARPTPGFSSSMSSTMASFHETRTGRRYLPR